MHKEESLKIMWYLEPWLDTFEEISSSSSLFPQFELFTSYSSSRDVVWPIGLRSYVFLFGSNVDDIGPAKCLITMSMARKIQEDWEACECHMTYDPPKPAPL